jgi:ribose-phosphate pyrophosphokinase
MTPAGRIDRQAVRLFSGSSNTVLAAAIASYLEVPLSPTRVRRFGNDNLYIQLGSTVRGRVVYVVQSFSAPVNDHVVELLMMLDIARSSGAHEVHAIIPYFSFARSDKKDAPRISITGRLMAKLIETAGATHVLTMSLHSPQVHGFFDVPTDALTARPVFTAYFRKQDLSRTVIVAPDAGRIGSAERFAKSLGDLPIIAGSKTRISDTQVKITGLIGNAEGCEHALIYDDEIANGTTTEAVARILIDRGMQKITVACTHGVLVGRAIQRLTALPELAEIVTTDTIPIPPEKCVEKVRILSVAPLFGEAIRRNYSGESIGDLFTFWKEFQTED